MTGIGVDILEIDRVRRVPQMRRVAEYVLSEDEIRQMDACADPARFLASRFAAKEAVIKAFPRPVFFHDFEVRKEGARPTVYFFNPQDQDSRVAVSISHSETHAVAMAVVT